MRETADVSFDSLTGDEVPVAHKIETEGWFERVYIRIARRSIEVQVTLQTKQALWKHSSASSAP